MAADLNLERVRSLPRTWSFGVTRAGRVFFINEEAKSTTWLHPVTGEAVVTGHRRTPDLPMGWEEGYTFEGARYYIKIGSGCPARHLFPLAHIVLLLVLLFDIWRRASPLLLSSY
ncbi:pleckstrin homology domain-containing family A member 5-like isoform X2 [Rhinatrema bivittatum]|uniref:pleckstrin homology domain-containing family A member 5-like isoform X2 n=2 Tax=Rhinatrema bivittatum TaxID=194408 RepID=UPI00112AB19A|nr:pleckstrin homology domain-containing family A member 5-like isoform X2 [Rhinatrema bivittatum]